MCKIWAGVIFLRINAKITLSVKFAVFRHLPFSIVGQNVAIYAVFSGKIDKFGNLTGYLTNSTSDLCLFYE